jgi:glycerophosphoryl diester phosphodiesterase
MLLIAHRGYHAVVPENTLTAFEAAVSIGANGIETDVRLSRDGLPLLIHDRVTRTGEPVAELTRAEIEKTSGHEIPTLEEALERFPGILWNIEIKTPAALPSVIEVVERHQARQILITSFHHGLVAACASVLKVNCGVLLAHRPRTLESLLADLNGDSKPRINHIVWDYEILDGVLVKQAAENGFRNWVYGPVTRAEHHRCNELGVDAVITDHPLLVRIPGL